MSAEGDDRVAAGPEPWWAPILEFLKHAAKSTLIFFVILSSALFIHVLLIGLRWMQLPDGMAKVFQLVEYAIIVLDLLVYVIFLGRSAQKLVVRLWDDP